MPNLPFRARAPVRATTRAKTAQRGYDAAWRKVRLVKLAEDPLCEQCKRKGLLKLAEEVDHIIPIADGGERLELNNLQSLCKSCHSRKTMAESRGGTRL